MKRPKALIAGFALTLVLVAGCTSKIEVRASSKKCINCATKPGEILPGENSEVLQPIEESIGSISAAETAPTPQPTIAPVTAVAFALDGTGTEKQVFGPLQRISGTCSSTIASINLRIDNGNPIPVDIIDNCSSGNWEKTVELAEPGTFHIEVIATSIDGKTTTATIALVYSPSELSVQPVFPLNGKDWNDYIATPELKNSVLDYNDSACQSTDTGALDVCVQAGTFRKLILPGLTTCQNITVSDFLGFFDWDCAPGTDQIVLYSTGLKPGKTLRSLVNESGWIANKVSVKRNNVEIAFSNNAAWWTNPVGLLPASPGPGPATLDTEGKIYVFSAEVAGAGYNINADKIGVVSLLQNSISFVPGATPNCNANGETGTPTVAVLICAGTQSFLWLETPLNGGGIGRGLQAFQMTHSRIGPMAVNSSFGNAVSLTTSTNNFFGDLTIKDTQGVGLYLYSDSKFNRTNKLKILRSTDIGLYMYFAAVGNFLEDTEIGHGSSWGIYTRASTNNVTFKKLKVYNNGTLGIYLRACDFCSISDAQVYNNGTYGIRVYEGAPDTTFINVLTANNGSDGFLSSQPRVTLVNLTSVNNLGHGVNLSAGNHVLANIVSVNNGGNGLLLQSDTNVISNLVAIGNGQTGVNLNASSENIFKGYLKLGSNATAACSVTGGTNTGVNAACASTHAASDFSFTPGLSAGSIFQGKFTGNLTENADIVNGTITAGTAKNWGQLLTSAQTVGTDGGVFPNGTNRSRCTTGECRIWDWNPGSADTIIKNAAGSLAPGQTCPASTLISLSDFRVLPRTFYPAAYESGSPLNNNNGLCEAGEDCIFAPHTGYNPPPASPGKCTNDPGSPTIAG